MHSCLVGEDILECSRLLERLNQQAYPVIRADRHCSVKYLSIYLGRCTGWDRLISLVQNVGNINQELILCWWPLESVATQANGPWVSIRVIGTIPVWGSLTITGWPTFRLSWNASILSFGADSRDTGLKKALETGLLIGPYQLFFWYNTEGNLLSHTGSFGLRKRFNKPLTCSTILFAWR